LKGLFIVSFPSIKSQKGLSECVKNTSSASSTHFCDESLENQPNPPALNNAKEKRKNEEANKIPFFSLSSTKKKSSSK
jgi:hypothetical protein